MIEREDRDEVAIVRLAHGPLNALDTDLCLAIIDTFGELAVDDSRGVVLTGAGRAFSAGLDLTRIIAGDTAYVRKLLPILDGAFEAVFAVHKPVVAAINGHAIAGGCVLAAACDFRVMVDAAATIGVPELHVGVPFPTAALEITRHAVGRVALRRLTSTGATLDARSALELGVVDEVVSGDELVSAARAKVAELTSAIPPTTYAIHKSQLNREVVERILRHRPHDMARVIDAWCLPETRARVAAYLDGVSRRARPSS